MATHGLFMFVFSIQLTVNKFADDWIPNRGPLVSEATDLTSEPQALPQLVDWILVEIWICNVKNWQKRFSFNFPFTDLANIGCFKLAIPSLFLLIFVCSTINSKFADDWIWTTSLCNWNNCSTNWATTPPPNAKFKFYFEAMQWPISKKQISHVSMVGANKNGQMTAAKHIVEAKEINYR